MSSSDLHEVIVLSFNGFVSARLLHGLIDLG